MIALYTLVATLLSPLVALVVVLHPRLRGHARERLGAVVPTVEPGAVWVHAASLGEGRAAAALVATLRSGHPGLAILRTCTSATARGQATGADQTVCLPVDIPFVVAAWLDRVRPRCLLLVEGELWPALLAACRRRGIPVAVVGARAGPGLRRWAAVPGLLSAVARGVVWLPADAAAAAIVGGAPIGELKLEAPVVPATLTWTRDAVIGGSTHEGDEAALLDAVALLSPRPLLVLAPREPARFEAVGALLTRRGECWVRRTALAGAVPPSMDVVLLDTFGELAGLYTHARAAFVGGTFDTRVGGHSPAEAQAAGCPVVHGPFTEGHAAAWAATASYPALAPDDLSEAFEAAFAARSAPPPRVAGARVAAALGPLLAAETPEERALRPWLWPLVPLWQAGVSLRPRPLLRGPVPVVAVGALTAGGSGKTPVTRWVADYLRSCEPVVVSRGYGRRPGNDVRLRGEAVELGDELAMLARRGHRVASAPDRLAGINAAVRAGARLAVLDDALQYGGVARDLEIVVLDARWPTGGGPIPVGTARVPVGWLARADVVWVNHGPLPPRLQRHVRPGVVVVEARYEAVGWLYRGRQLPLDALPTLPVAAFAGIARPEGFFGMLRRLGLPLDKTWSFPDHHVYVWSDLYGIEAWLDDHVVVTTEKDAARLPPDTQAYALLVEPKIVSGEGELRAALDRVAAGAGPALGAGGSAGGSA